MKKIKIFFPYCGETMGGSHISSLTLINNLKERDYDILIGIHSNGIFKKYCKIKKIPFININKKFFSNSNNFFYNFIFFLLNFFFFRSFLNNNKIDVVHLNDYRMLNTWALSSYFSKVKKIIFHQRNPMPDSKWVRINLNYITNIISISKFVFSTLTKDLKKKSSIIRNPIEQIKKKKIKKKNRIAFVGNYWKKKRPEIFFKFADKLVSQKKNFQFYFIGNISNKNIKLIYEQYPNLKKKLIFTKYLLNPYNLIQTCKIIICPAINEGFGRVPLEAGYLHVPCIISYHGGHKEFKKYNMCLYARGNNEESYLKIYKKALNSKIKKKLIKNTIKYNNNFTLPNIHVNNVIKIYKF